MRTSLKTLSMLVLGLWLGAALLFIAVAKVAFSVLPPEFADPANGVHAAGLVVAGALADLHYLGLALGVLFLFCCLLLNSMVRWHSIVPQALLVLAMLVITMYSQFSVIPRMDTARAAAGGRITSVPPDNPARQVFDHLHQLSTHLEGIVLVCGFVAFLLAGREPVLRVSRVGATTTVL